MKSIEKYLTLTSFLLIMVFISFVYILVFSVLFFPDNQVLSVIANNTRVLHFALVSGFLGSTSLLTIIKNQ
jgi:hypothetical protein